MNFFENVDFKNEFKNEFDIINEKYAADSNMNCLTESIFRPFGLKSLVRQRESKNRQFLPLVILKKSRAEL